MRPALAWIALACLLAAPVFAAAASPLLQWRSPVYIAAGFAGILAMALMALQPLLAAAFLPGTGQGAGRRAHRAIGALVLGLVVAHVAGLWITSPPDVIDALTFRSPTPFSDWGVIALLAVAGAALLAATRRRFRGRLRLWRRAHTALAAIAVAGTVAHALLIQGTMENVTKIVLAIFLIVALAAALARLGTWTPRR